MDQSAGETGEKGLSKSRRKSWTIAFAAVLLAAATTFATGLASWSADRVVALLDPSEELVSYSVSQAENECGPGTFLPEPAARGVLDEGPPRSWSTIQQKSGAAFVEFTTAEVSVQGASKRTVTLTGIDFSIVHKQRPRGAAFFSQCGGPFEGRTLSVDLDTTPPRIISSNATAVSAMGNAKTRPIRFPWTVSLTDPLLLYVTGSTDECYCIWTAKIPWVSGSQRGTIDLDNNGEGFSVISADGLRAYTRAEGQWDAFKLYGS